MSLLFTYCGYSFFRTRSNSTVIPVLLAIPKLQVSDPGQAVISSKLLYPASVNPSLFNSV